MSQKLFRLKDIILEFQKFQKEIKLRKGDLLDLSDISEQGPKTMSFSCNIHVLFEDGIEAIIFSGSGNTFLVKKVYRRVNGLCMISEVHLKKGVLCCSKLITDKSLLKINEPAVIPVTIRENSVSDLHEGVPVKEVRIFNPGLVKIIEPSPS